MAVQSKVVTTTPKSAAPIAEPAAAPVTIAAALKEATARQAALRPPPPPPRMVPPPNVQTSAKPAEGGADNRVAPRVAVTGGIVRIDSKEYTVGNISTSGFLLKPYEGSLIKLQRFYFTLLLPDGDKVVEFNASGRVARVGPGELGAYFLDLLPDVYHAIQEYLSR